MKLSRTEDNLGIFPNGAIPEEIFNYIIQFVNIIVDAKTLILVSKKMCFATIRNELFLNFMKLLRKENIFCSCAPIGTTQYYFMKACYYGNPIIKNIVENNMIDIHADDEYAFQLSCENGHLEVAKWLIELSQSEGFSLIDINADKEFAFRWSCENGHLEVAKWLIELSQCEGFTLIDIHARYEYAFRWSCENGHLEVAKWLIELSQCEGFSLIDIHAYDEYAFRLSCKHGHLEVAKWLIELSRCDGFTLIDIHAENEYAFKRSCKKGHLNIAKWLIELYRSEGRSLINISMLIKNVFLERVITFSNRIIRWYL